MGSIPKRRSRRCPVAAAHGYRARYLPIGEVDPVVGAASQMAVFEQGQYYD
ncbi:MAG: hypothetical protein SGI73_20845 [Chloroflexota bacterium]|nr:hypothetical protein [Chloroflexota bacterium]